MPLLNELNALETSGLVRLAAVQPELEYLFRHALVQDAAYGSLLKNDRRQLHQNVGEVLERLYPQQLDDLAATLALHFEKAEQRDKAVYYFQMAGERASEGFANAEAMEFYQSAIEQADLALVQETTALWQSQIADLWENLADVHERMGQHEAARTAYSRALEIQGVLQSPDPVRPARLHRKIGTAHMIQRQYEEANQSWEQAEHSLGDISKPQPDATGSEWIDIQLERFMYHYWKSDLPGMKVISDRLLPVTEWMGEPLQRAKALYIYNLYLFRVQRYVVSDDVMAMVESNVFVVEQTGKLTVIYDHHFTAGFFRFFRRELDEAEAHLHFCLDLSERMGDPVRISRAANYLMFASRMRGQIEATQRYFETVLSTTWAGPMADYTFTVQACQSWIAWRAGKLEESRAYGIAAKETLLGPFSHYPFQWVVYFPLLAVAVTEKQMTEACEYARRMLDPAQILLPDDLTVALDTAVKLGEVGDAEAAQQSFDVALKLATVYGYV